MMKSSEAFEIVYRGCGRCGAEVEVLPFEVEGVGEIGQK